LGTRLKAALWTDKPSRPKRRDGAYEREAQST
jgi:hypothetical protein